MLMLHGAQLQRNQTSEIMEVVIRHREFRMVERLLELGVNPKLVKLEMGDTPLHAALSIALDKDKGWSCCFVYVEKGHTPLHTALSIALDKDKGWSCCVVYVEKGHTPLHAALSIALVITLDKKSGQVCCVCCLCGERPHAFTLLWSSL